IVNVCVAVEQFGYGFGFTAYMLYMISVAEGEHKTAHYAICTGFMALGMMIPGMFSGWLQEIIGYQHFFIWVLIATIPGVVLIPFLPLDPEFGKKVN
ncbi:MAG: MFS transporter, partial [Fidelibacterota bacterium]